jgi:hypothetical protein
MLNKQQENGRKYDSQLQNMLFLQGAGVAVEHTSNIVKTLKQVNTGYSYRDNVKFSIAKKGLIRTFSDGLSASMSQFVFRQFARVAIVAVMNKMFDKFASENTKEKHPVIRENFGLGMLALVDTPIQSVINRVRTVQITSKDTVNAFDVVKKDPFKGMLPLSIRQGIFFFLMFAGDKAAKKYFGTEELSMTQKWLSAIATNAVYIPFSAPFDMATTIIQAKNSECKTMSQAFAKTWSDSGFNKKNFAKITMAGSGARAVYNGFSIMANMAAIDWADRASKGKSLQGKSVC